MINSEDNMFCSCPPDKVLIISIQN